MEACDSLISGLWSEAVENRKEESSSSCMGYSFKDIELFESGLA